MGYRRLSSAFFIYPFVSAVVSRLIVGRVVYGSPRGGGVCCGYCLNMWQVFGVFDLVFVVGVAAGLALALVGAGAPQWMGL